jgi:ASCH domain
VFLRPNDFAPQERFSLAWIEDSALHRRPAYALSVRQPWAALIVSGRKTIEIRKWSTAIRGRVHIHAARLADGRPDAWGLAAEDLQPLAEQTGGLIGTAELTSCVVYRTLRRFAEDARNHLNDPAWFEPPMMYGFTFRGATPRPFVPCREVFAFSRLKLPK